MIPEAPLQRSGEGLAPAGDGWFVLNARESRWQQDSFGAYTGFEGTPHFPMLGFNIGVLEPGQPACYYHTENDQEDFLVLAGEALLIIEEQERPLKAWDFVHCPPWTAHVIVGAGDGPCTILAVGTRSSDEGSYPASPVAQRHHAGVQKEVSTPGEAYAGLADRRDVPYREGWLPG